MRNKCEYHVHKAVRVSSLPEGAHRSSRTTGKAEGEKIELSMYVFKYCQTLRSASKAERACRNSRTTGRTEGVYKTEQIMNVF